MTKAKPAAKAKGSSEAAPAPETNKFDHIGNIPLRKALLRAGGFTALGEALGVSRQSIHKWDAIPDRFAVQVEELYGIPRAQIAPHLFKGLVPSK